MRKSIYCSICGAPFVNVEKLTGVSIDHTNKISKNETKNDFRVLSLCWLSTFIYGTHDPISLSVYGKYFTYLYRTGSSYQLQLQRFAQSLLTFPGKYVGAGGGNVRRI